MSGIDAVIVTALVAGFLGSTHCFAMCGGISGLAAASAVEKSLRHQFGLAVIYNVGRLASYAALGALVAAFGGAVVEGVPALAGPVRIVGGVLIVLIGLQIAFNLRPLEIIEHMGGIVWTKISPLAKGLLPVASGTKALGLGLLWGPAALRPRLQRIADECVDSITSRWRAGNARIRCRDAAGNARDRPECSALVPPARETRRASCGWPARHRSGGRNHCLPGHHDDAV